MNARRFSARYKALIAANLVIAILGILLRPIYPKSIYIAMFVIAVAMAVISAWLVLLTLREPAALRREKQIGVIVAFMCLGVSMYGIYLTLRSILK
jgi:hypothetical protein